MVVLWPCHSQWPRWHRCKRRSRDPQFCQSRSALLQGSKSNSPLSCFGKVNSKVMIPPNFAHQLQLPTQLVKLNSPLISSWCSPMELCVLPHSHQSGEHLAAWERHDGSPSGCQPLQTSGRFLCVRGARGLGHATDVGDHVPTCLLSICVHSLPPSSPCFLLSFIFHCTITDCSDRLTPIVQSGLLNREGKKKKRNC